MIHALLEYAQDRGLASKPGYAKKAIKWVLDFDDTGRRFTGIQKSDRWFLAPDLTQPELLALDSLKGKAAHFMVASLGTLLGWDKDEKKKTERARRATLCWMFEEAGKTCPHLRVLSEALLDSKTAEFMLQAALSVKKPSAKTTDLATIRIGGMFPVEDDAWHEWWEAFRSSLRKKSAHQRLMPCFGTGELVMPEKTHPKLKKLMGVGLSQPHAPIITFDKPAFESYGLDHSRNAAMDIKTATAYVGAIDDLLEKSVIYSWRRPKPKAKKELARDFARLGGARLIYWYAGPSGARIEVEKHNDLIGAMLGSAHKDEEPPDDDEEERILTESRLRQQIDRIRSGEAAQPIGNVRFCLLAISGAGGRAMVRDFLEGTVLRLADTTDQWFNDLALVTYWGRAGRHPSLEQVLSAPLVGRKRDQDYLKWITPAGAWRQSLWRAALNGGRIPHTAFVRALLAHNSTVIKGDLFDDVSGAAARWLSRLRLALVKAHLIRKGVEMKPALDPEHPSPAYHCGRLLAVYDALQRAALGDVGAGVIQRYYGGALTNPTGVFGQLSRLVQTHLSKLDGGLAHIYKDRIAEIHNGMCERPASYPPALSLEDQGLFALGFWHQIAATNKGIEEAAAAKKAREESSKRDQSNLEAM